MKMIYKLKDGTIVELLEDEIVDIRIRAGKSPSIEANNEDGFFMALIEKEE